MQISFVIIFSVIVGYIFSGDFQVRISFTGIDDEMSIMFVTDADTSTDTYYVDYSFGDVATLDKRIDSTNEVFNIPAESYTRVIHEVVLTNIPYGGRVYYRVGCHQDSLLKSNIFYFIMHDPTLQEDFLWLLYADGQSSGFDLTLEHLNQTGIMFDSVLTMFPGDFVFCDGGGKEHYWDTFQRRAEVVDAYHPSMYVEGNHEYSNGFVSFRARMSKHIATNSGATNSNMYYSMNFRNVHFVSVSSHSYNSIESQSSDQYKWLENDLKNVDRSKTPFIVVQFHYPMYTTCSHSSDTSLRNAIEPLLNLYKVTLVVNGHNHNYERSCEVYQSTCYTGKTPLEEYVIDKGTVHIVAGIAGGRGPCTSFSTQPEWCIVRQGSSSWGYVKIKTYIDPPKMEGWYYHINDVNDEEELDHFIIKLKVDCFGLEVDDSEVCSGNGTCIGVDKCSCKKGYKGIKCNEPEGKSSKLGKLGGILIGILVPTSIIVVCLIVISFLLFWRLSCINKYSPVGKEDDEMESFRKPPIPQRMGEKKDNYY